MSAYSTLMPNPHAPDHTDEPAESKGISRAWRDLRRIWLLVVISAVAPIMINGVLPANSAIMAEFDISYALVQWTLTIFMVALLIAQPILGYCADRWGRRPVMYLSLSVFALGCFISASAGSMTVLLIGRFLQGFGGSVCTFLPRAVVRDLYPQDRAASMIGFMTMAMMMAPMFGPAFGGWVTDQFDWRYIYIILGIVGAVVAIIAWRSLAETQNKSEAGSSVPFFKALLILMSMPEFRSYALLIAGSVGVYYSFLGSAPYLVMEVREQSASAFGRWFILVAIGYLIGNTAAAFLSERMGMRRMISLGQIPLVIGISGFWLSLYFESPGALFFPMACIAFSNGMSLPSLTTGAMNVYPPLAASAGGIAGALQTGVGILLTIVLGVLLPISEIWFQIVVTCSAASGLFAWYAGQAKTHTSKKIN